MVLLRRFLDTSGCTNLPCRALALSWLDMNKLQHTTCIAVQTWHRAQADKPLWEHGQLAKQTGEHISVCIWPHQCMFKDPFITHKKDSVRYTHTQTRMPLHACTMDRKFMSRYMNISECTKPPLIFQYPQNEKLINRDEKKYFINFNFTIKISGR